MKIFHLVYRSFATENNRETDFKSLLKNARESNALRGITGILIYRQGAFVQLIEGEESEVRSLLRKICEDKRHERVTTLIEASSDERLYSDWSMAFVTEKAQQSGSMLKLFEALFQTKKRDKNQILPLIKSFSGNIERD